ncbi:MAG: 2,5-diamino-6-(ribosylamino)-4(3H)-pyrimidinone 5'-phosphate reductase [Methanosphaera stadtmanae]|nr:2,5-diamino-6-(ribosylamino)-4(3H)-pyrimidinone 5'-phosphate reductase [Methanosphaera stadtmanae]
MKPFVLLNSAMTVDGKIATENSQMKISGKKDMVRVHQLRKEFDSIMVGINTVIIDNPKLTISKIEANKNDNPVRIIVDSSARIPLESKVLNDDAKTILLVSQKAEQSKIDKLKDKCDIIIAGQDKVNLKEALKKIYEKGIHSILLEGGSTLNFSMFQEKLIDKVSICIGSKILGGKNSKTFVDGTGFDKNNCVNLKLEKYYIIDEDIVLEYLVKYDEKK